ncbi:MAG TPA: serine hydrolase domain-containing protein [Candidatus Saccharimonadales bacterium]|jgi:CubicO group peptidase (beta-lactamase class C family)|nr:serine hydrolase domain-containing protein [Candidatus Saccharimonadales bacterium]
MRGRLVWLVLMLVFPAVMLAQAPAPGSPTHAPLPHEMTAADVEAFLDGFVPMQLERENIAGAVVCVVKEGKVLFARGYGYADVERKTPVTVDATLFRPGSIAKLFTWTAVMQLVEQGKLNLDEDINSYLDFKVPATFPQPITLRHILTHTTGFEESVARLFIQADVPIVPLGQYLRMHMPRRIFPPGTTPAYSNYGATLAGYIVERVSGRPFDVYVAEQILKPLGMTRSSFSQPLNAELQPMMSKGYATGSGKPHPFEVVQASPAGSLSTTAADLAHFMIAHLQEGRYENTQILKPETARQMHARQAGLSPAMNAMALGFYEESRNGRRIIGHGGDTIVFHSDLHLMLDAGVGFYVSYNSAGKGELSPRSALWSHFIDRYFPWEMPPETAVPATAVADSRSVAGYYLSSRRSEGTFLRATNPFGEAHVAPQKDGTLKVEPFKDFKGELKVWHETGPLVYRAVEGQDRIAFVPDRNGRMQLVIGFPALIFQRVSLLDSGPFNTALLAFSIGMMGLSLLLLPVAAVIRGHYHVRLELTSPQRGLRRILRIVCAIDMAFMVLFMVVVAAPNPLELLSGKLDLWIRLLQVLGVIGALGALPAIYAALRLWRERDLWIWGRVFDLLVMLAAVGFTWFVVHWNVINFSLNY